MPRGKSKIDIALELERMAAAEGRPLPPDVAAYLGAARKQGVVKSPPAPTKTDATMAGKLSAANLLSEQLDEVETMYNADFKGQPLERGFGLGEYLPTQTNKRFDAAAQGLFAPAKQLVRSPGEGTFTDPDAAQLQTQLPESGVMDGVNEQRIKNLRRLIRQTQEQYAPKPALGGKPATGALGAKKATPVDVVIEFDANGKPVRR